MDAQSQSLPPPDPHFKRLLSICDYYLGTGDYNTCRQFAVKAQIYNPDHREPYQILAICSILISASSSDQPDWYSILHLPKFTEDQTAMFRNYNYLLNLINPEKNHHPSAAKAREWISKALTVLSNPKGKALAVNNLKAEAKNGQGNGVSTFLTRCPFCSYMYEYDKMYKNCNLMCQNSACRVPYVAVPLGGSGIPASELVNNGVYLCEIGKESGTWELLDPLAPVSPPSEK